MSIQVQIRGDSNSAIMAAVLALRELGVDTTNMRLHIGDNVSPGGIILPNVLDIQENTLIAGVAGGTANALTLTLPIPIEGYEKFQSIIFEATANNTGSATMDYGDGVIVMKKKTAAGLTNLAADDIVDGGLYRGLNDGTYLQIEALSAIAAGLTEVTQADLVTSTGIVSTATGGAVLVLPGGQYGFYPQLRYSGSNVGVFSTIFGRAQNVSSQYFVAPDDANKMSTSFQSVISLGVPSGGATIYAQQRFVTASKPYNIDGEEVAGFFFALVDSNDEIVSSYISDTPPWAYNGPTDIRATHKDPITGKKFRKVPRKRTLEEIMDGAEMIFDKKEITHAVKNADMNLIPHPFASHDPSLRPVMLDPTDERIAALIELQNSGGAVEVSDAIDKGFIKVNSDAVALKGPKGLAIQKMSFKYTKGR